jgi:hypothetical protein
MGPVHLAEQVVCFDWKRVRVMGRAIQYGIVVYVGVAFFVGGGYYLGGGSSYYGGGSEWGDALGFGLTWPWYIAQFIRGGA